MNVTERQKVQSALFLFAGKYVYQPMTSVCQLPSTSVPVAPSGHTHTMNLSISLAERFLRTAPKFQAPPCPESPKFCVISDLFVDDYMVKRINGKMCYVQRPPPPTPNPTHQPQTPAPQPAPQRTNKHTRQTGPTVKHNQPNEKISGPKMDHCSSPSSSEDSGINALGLHYMESCDEDSCVDDDDEEEEDDELSTDGDSSPGSLWDQDECTVLSPSKSMVEIIEKIETTVWRACQIPRFRKHFPTLSYLQVHEFSEPVQAHAPCYGSAIRGCPRRTLKRWVMATSLLYLLQLSFSL